MARTQISEGGYKAALARLDEVYGSTSMDVDEYLRRKEALAQRYLDSDTGSGFFERLAAGDRATLVKLAAVIGVLLTVLIIAAIVAAIIAGAGTTLMPPMEAD